MKSKEGTLSKIELLEQFDKIAIHNRIDPFFKEDIDCFFEDEDVFSLNLKRSKKKVSLYGSEHVWIRQLFFNNCDVDTRIEIFFEKVAAKSILDWVFEQLKVKKQDIIDVIDIGKGRSIYKLTTVKNGEYVLKEKQNNYQEQFHNLAKVFKLPSSKSWFTQANDSFWELTPFLDEDEVYHFKKDKLFEIYAKAAAFGDLIELGDRHFENYITKNDDLIAIDVSHLLCGDNEHWTKKYISGGLYECCLLQYFMSEKNNFKQYLVKFFNAYSGQAHQLFQKINDGLYSDIECKSLTKFKATLSKWKDADHFISHMKSIYFDAIREMLERVTYKQLLQQMHGKGIDLNKYQILKMYQLADSGRLSTFFRLEDEPIDVVEQVKYLAADSMGVTNAYYKDTNLALQPLFDILKEPQLVK